MLSNITNEKRGVVTLLPGLKLPYEDGDWVLIYDVEGMEDVKFEEKGTEEEEEEKKKY